jgi:hypothetical protein
LYCLSFFFWPLYCLSFFFWSLYCMFYNDQKKRYVEEGQTIQWPKEEHTIQIHDWSLEP